jgi:hypothetical protein
MSAHQVRPYVGDVPTDDRPTDIPHYEIRLGGRLSPRWAAWFDGLGVLDDHGTTVLRGPLVDQAALHGVLAKVRDLGLPLLAVRRGAADLEALLERLADSC